MADILKVVPAKFWDNGNGWFWQVRTEAKAMRAGGSLDKAALDGDVPVLLKRNKETCRDHWLYKEKVYTTTDQELTQADVVALVNETENRRRLRLEKAHALQAMSEELSSGSKRAHIAQDVKVLVWQRDKGRCVRCDSQSDLEFDHVIPVAMGGSNTARNLQLLCEPCNRRKGATLG